MIAETNGITIDLVDTIPLAVVEQIRGYFHAQDLIEESSATNADSVKS